MRDKLYFLHDDNHQILMQADTIVLLVIARHALRSQKSKFAIYQERRDECDFLHANKHQILLQIKAINFGGHG